MKLEKLLASDVCKDISRDAKGLGAMYGTGHDGRPVELRDKHTSLDTGHVPILIYAALSAAGVKDDEVIPFTAASQAQIVQFVADTGAPLTPANLSKAKDQLLNNLDPGFNQRISNFLAGQDNEDFIPVAVSDMDNPDVSHGMRVHLIKEVKDSKSHFTIKIMDSAAGGGLADGGHYQWLKYYLENFIRGHYKYKTATIQVQPIDSPYQQDYLCLDHTAFAVADYVLKKMGRPCHFEIPKIDERRQFSPLREALYAAHQQISPSRAVKIQPLVRYIRASVLKQNLPDQKRIGEEKQIANELKGKGEAGKRLQQQDRDGKLLQSDHGLARQLHQQEQKRLNQTISDHKLAQQIQQQSQVPTTPEIDMPYQAMARHQTMHQVVGERKESKVNSDLRLALYSYKRNRSLNSNEYRHSLFCCSFGYAKSLKFEVVDLILDYLDKGGKVALRLTPLQMAALTETHLFGAVDSDLRSVYLNFKVFFDNAIQIAPARSLGHG